MTKTGIANCVEQLINQFHTRNPLELCEYLNINLYFHYLGDLLKGYYLYYQDTHIIVINKSLEKQEQRIILGHELGHALAHSGFSRFFSESGLGISEDRIELEANLFCSELLISDEEILASAGDSSLEEICTSLSLPDWIIDCKVQMLISKGYKEFEYQYICNKDSIKR